MHRRVVILFPTETEAADFLQAGYSDLPCNIVQAGICGVGMAETAAAVSTAIAAHAPSLVVLAGVAGHYAGSGLQVGDVVLVGRERVADLGALRPGGFQPLFACDYACPYAEKFDAPPRATANTVSTGATPYHRAEGAKIENMEGAALFAICLRAGVPFLEVRAVSNPVSAEGGGWNLPLATANLARALRSLLEEIGRK